MRSIIPLSLIGLSCLPASAEVESEIPIGIEAVAGIRSDYVYRGFDLAGTSLDLQLEAEIALSNETTLNLGTWHLAESGGPFSETGAFVDLRHEVNEQLTIGTSITYRNFRGTALDSGVDFGVFTTYQFSDDWDGKLGAYYDAGNDAFYASGDLRWSKPISESAFVSLENGVSYVSDYLNRSGFNDLYGRLSLTYAISDTAAFTPFVGWSVQLDGNVGSDTVFGGIWFEFIF